MQEPFRTLYFTLVEQNFPVGVWRYGVKLTHEAIYIGRDAHHFTFLRNHGGWHVTINGQHEGQVEGSFDDLIRMRWDVSPEIGDAFKWFSDHRSWM